MKKAGAVFLSLLLALGCIGCGANDIASDGVPESAAATEQATPEPEGVALAFGKEEVVIAVVSNGDDEESQLFFDAVTAEGESMGITVQAEAAGEDFETAVEAVLEQDVDSLIIFLPHALADNTILKNAQIPRKHISERGQSGNFHGICDYV